MAIALLDLSLWRDRLQEELPEIRDIGTAANLASAYTSVLSPPSIFFVPGGDTASSQPYGSGAIIQEVTSIIDVLLCVSNVADGHGGAAWQDDLQPLRTKILNLLHGWTPEEIAGPLEYRGGRPVSFDQQLFWWVDSFSAQIFFRSIGGPNA